MESIEALVEGGRARPLPPLGPALSQAKLPVGEVIAKINELTRQFEGLQVPIKVLYDPNTKKWEVEVGTPPVSQQLKAAAGIEKGASDSKEKVGDVSLDKVIEIAKATLENSNASSLKQRVKEVLGTALSMGLTCEGKDPREVIREIDEGKYASAIS